MPFSNWCQRESHIAKHHNHNNHESKQLVQICLESTRNVGFALNFHRAVDVTVTGPKEKEKKTGENRHLFLQGFVWSSFTWWRTAHVLGKLLATAIQHQHDSYPQYWEVCSLLARSWQIYQLEDLEVMEASDAMKKVLLYHIMNLAMQRRILMSSHWRFKDEQWLLMGHTRPKVFMGKKKREGDIYPGGLKGPVDHCERFIIKVGWVGKIHDSRMLAPQVTMDINWKSLPIVIPQDSANPHLMAPFTGYFNRRKQQFNFALSCSRALWSLMKCSDAASCYVPPVTKNCSFCSSMTAREKPQSRAIQLVAPELKR